MLARVRRPSPILTAELLGGAVAGAGLLGVLVTGFGLGPFGLVVGATAAAALVAVLLGAGVPALGPAGRVTLVRGVLVVGVTALVADPVSTPALVVLAAVALLLDGVDGQVARRRNVVSEFGARFDMELDAFLLLVLSWYVAGQLGTWVLLIGLARYLFVAAGVVLPWLGGELETKFSGKVVAAAQGIVLVIAASQLLPAVLAQLLVAAALVALLWSFGRDVVRLWRGTGTHPMRVRRGLAAVVTVLAAVLVLLALLTPGDIARLVEPAFVRIPFEVLVALVVAVVLPAWARAVLAWIAGVVLGLMLVLTLFDLGFSLAIARPFDPARDAVLLTNAYDFVAETSGPVIGVIVSVLLALLAIALLVGTGGAVARLSRIAADHRSGALRLAGVLAVAWFVAWTVSAQLLPGVPVASRDTSIRAVDRAIAIGDGVRDQQAFEREASVDAYRDVPGDRLLTALRGHDVVVAVIESYGMSALDDPAMAGPVRAVVADGERRLGAVGYSARTGMLSSPVAGGGSWLAHATLLSGLWIDGEQRHTDLTSSSRLTLSRAFHEAGWRTVAVQPGTTGPWPEAGFFGLDRAYAGDDLGYRGPRFSWSPMPDQYAFAALDRLERGPGAPPTMAEMVLTSSHGPWAPLPRTVPWDGGRRRQRVRARGAAALVPVDPHDRRGAGPRRLPPVRRVLALHALRLDRAPGRGAPRPRARARRPRRPPALARGDGADDGPQHPDLDRQSRPRRARPDRRLGLVRRAHTRPRRPVLADGRLPRPLPRRVRAAALTSRRGRTSRPSRSSPSRSTSRSIDVSVDRADLEPSARVGDHGALLDVGEEVGESVAALAGGVRVVEVTADVDVVVALGLDGHHDPAVGVRRRLDRDDLRRAVEVAVLGTDPAGLRHARIVPARDEIVTRPVRPLVRQASAGRRQAEDSSPLGSRGIVRGVTSGRSARTASASVRSSASTPSAASISAAWPHGRASSVASRSVAVTAPAAPAFPRTFATAEFATGPRPRPGVTRRTGSDTDDDATSAIAAPAVATVTPAAARSSRSGPSARTSPSSRCPVPKEP